MLLVEGAESATLRLLLAAFDRSWVRHNTGGGNYLRLCLFFIRSNPIHSYSRK